MLKRILIIVAIVAILLIGIVVSSALYFRPQADRITDHILENNENAAILLVQDGDTICSLNPEKMMPLASTMKIIIAIEYAYQAADGIIDADQMITFSDIDKYWIKKTDGGAHRIWKNSVSSKAKDNKIPIREIAKGMIKYSSNANTEWLIDKLGLDNINSRIDSLGIKDHSEIYYIVSSLLVGKEEYPSLKADKIVEKIKQMPMQEYIAISQEIHNKIKNDQIGNDTPENLTMEYQRLWSERLPASTAAEYVELMSKLNSKEYFSDDVHKYLDEVMEFPMENSANQKWLKHAGMKGGSTMFVLTKALYATDNEGNTTELAYFIDNLGYIQNTRLQISMNKFELEILTNGEFRDLLQEKLQ
ncbi:MAG: serine hydrolase [Candidatus Zixiibacteriota bacterium]